MSKSVKILILVCILVVSVVSSLSPIAAVILTAVMFAGASLVLNFKKIPNYFIFLLGIILIGYAFAGRGFAYLGIPPIFIGEMVLALGLLSTLSGIAIIKYHNFPLFKVLGIFILWGTICTVPYIDDYGLFALRDGVVWGYSLFAISVAIAMVVKRDFILAVPRWFGKWTQWFLLLIPALLLLYRLYRNLIPRWPWGPELGVPVLNLKGGDIGVHLAGIMAFLALGLNRHFVKKSILPEWLLWTTWGITFLLVGLTSRGAFVTVIVAFSVMFGLKPFSKWVKPLFIGAIAVLVIVTFDLEFDIGLARKISYEQLENNVQSIVGNTDINALEGSKRWRILWWSKIINYTFYGEYFWSGKGYGINLASDDGFQAFSDQSLRSPHNSHLTFLARSGVTGLVLWTILQVSFFLMLLRNYLRSKNRKNQIWANINLWLIIYWIAFIVNGAFDVFLEGPQGGIWFWSLFGYGMALIFFNQKQRYQTLDFK